MDAIKKWAGVIVAVTGALGGQQLPGKAGAIVTLIGAVAGALWKSPFFQSK